MIMQHAAVKPLMFAFLPYRTVRFRPKADVVGAELTGR